MSKPIMTRSIILTTIYKDDDENKICRLVTSYKVDPKGEEFFGGIRRLKEYHLSKIFINRIMSVSGQGTHIPLINSRIMLSVEDDTVTLTNSVNPYPRTDDYKNPFQRENGSIMRIGLGKVLRVYHTSHEDTVLSPELLTDMLGEGQITLLPRRSKISQLADKQIRRKDDTPNEDLHSTKKGAIKKVTTNRDRKNTFNRREEEIQKIPPLAPPLSWSPVDNDDKDEKRKEFKLMLTHKCTSLSIQNNLIYPVNKFKSDLNQLSASILYDESIDKIISRKVDDPYVYDPKIEKLSNMRVLLMSRGAKVIGISDDVSRVRGVELIEDEVGLIIVDDNLA